MSFPARDAARLERAPKRRLQPQPPADPDRKPPWDPAPRQTSPSPSAAARPRSRRRRGLHYGFVGFASVVVSALVVGIVALNALLAQTGIQAGTIRAEIQDLAAKQVQLTDQAAKMSAPGRIASWAAAHSFVQPDAGHVVIIARGNRSP